MNKPTIFRIQALQMESEPLRIILNLGFQEDKAQTYTSVFTDNSLEGVPSHGIIRFARFVKHIQNGKFTSMLRLNWFVRPVPLNNGMAT